MQSVSPETRRYLSEKKGRDLRRFPLSGLRIGCCVTGSCFSFWRSTRSDILPWICGFSFLFLSLTRSLWHLRISVDESA